MYSERYFKKLAGRNNIENALGELESLIQGERDMATVQVLQDTSGLKHGA
jgi:hypothetical protein